MVADDEGTWLMSLIYAPQGTVGPADLITEDTQIQWDGLVMGIDTYFGYKNLTGWDDLPGVDLSDTPRPHQHGDFPGNAYGQPRIITFDTQIWSPKDVFPELRREWLRRTQIQQAELPLVIRQHGDTMMVFARVVGRTVPIKRAYFGGYPEASIQWKATDPRKYSVDESSIILNVPSSTGGLTWSPGLTWDVGLDWGVDVQGSGSVINSGLADTPLRFEFNGPLSGPYFVNAFGNWTLGFDLDLAAGEILIADARAGTVTLAGVDRYYTLALNSDLPEDCLAQSGSTSVQFAPSSLSDTGFVQIFWRDAQM